LKHRQIFSLANRTVALMLSLRPSVVCPLSVSLAKKAVCRSK